MGVDPLLMDLLHQHRSIRSFTNEPVPEAVLEEILEAARRAPTSHHIQAYSIIRITDPEKRKRLAHLCGNQRYVEEAPEFLVFTADFYRHSLISEARQQPFEIHETENVLVGAVDAALAAENAYIAAKAAGLGGVMIGGIRNEPDGVRECLDLPPYTFPVMGMCLGYAGEIPEQKPRLPKEAVVFENTYRTDGLQRALNRFDEAIHAYYTARSTNQRDTDWSTEMSRYFAKKRRRDLTPFLINQGFSMQ
ncbi:oxygen-insensitive NADPH nitroreductase [Alkalicoccus urumqiensis]|uniref:Oxygen-insensitive NADPH nitroreductase n=1 Tax=Alkalicoccus urumqiensis TaxID=1548213 RepID=A0A2P6MLW5_ALKUR|nr:oxygen-insensitive NADPH nitroreductase [Alkalicoccus urumqiensis]PRO67279.1 oxygen-insensitive NADPH nitroreductase [Alkalicoccus urumqiensis]